MDSPVLPLVSTLETSFSWRGWGRTKAAKGTQPQSQTRSADSSQSLSSLPLTKELMPSLPAQTSPCRKVSPRGQERDAALTEVAGRRETDGPAGLSVAYP